MTKFVYFGFTSLALACFALPSTTQAVVPAPDGGYPGANTAEGDSALLSLTTGAYNTAVGFASLRALTTGNLNTATGADALLVNTGDQNTATGAGALLSNTTGSSNTANGALALLGNTESSFNVAIGAGALQTGPVGYDNTAVGFYALHSGGDQDTAVGSRALESQEAGNANTAIGCQALAADRRGMFNTAIGYKALLASTLAENNTAVGNQALASFNNTNPPLGDGDNTAVGAGALSNDRTGFGNTALGFAAGTSITTANHVICIGAAGNNVDNSCYIGNIFNATSSGGSAVFVNMNGRLGTTTSSRRFKEEIKPAGKASEALYALQPVTFHYKRGIDPEGTTAPQFGLVAEDVEKVNPDLVVRDKEGKPYSVRYDQVNAMLLNEFLKEHRAFLQQREKVEKLEASIAEQQKIIKALSAHLMQQDLKIEKVTARVEIDRARPRVVTNDPQTVESNAISQ